MTPPAWVELPDPGTGPGLRLVVPWPPSDNANWRAFAYRSRQTGKMAARTISTERARDFKTEVAETLRGCRPLVGSIAIASLDLWFPTATGDLFSRHKALFDALEGLAYLNDGQIRWCGPTSKGIDRARPRVDLELYGERFATPAEVLKYELTKAAAKEKRKKTTAANRALKRLAR